MSYYVCIHTQTFGVLTSLCGSSKIAGRLSNVDNDCAGNDYCLVYAHHIAFNQPHDDTGGANCSTAPFMHAIEVLLPDYEPLIACIFNVINNHDVIKKLYLNATKRSGNGKEVITQQYQLEDGLLTDFAHKVRDQRQETHLRHRGEVKLGFKFQSLTVEDKVNNSTGVATTNRVA